MVIVAIAALTYERETTWWSITVYVRLKYSSWTVPSRE